MEKIRRVYGVPAKRGLAVKYDGLPAMVTSSDGVYLRLRFESGATSIHHPLYLIDYLDGIDYATAHDERVETFRRSTERPASGAPS